MIPKLNEFVPNHWLKPPTEQEIDKLPTIDDVKKRLIQYEKDYSVTREEPIKLMYESSPQHLDKMGLSYSSSDKDKFILTKTMSGWSLKPNISTSHFLFRGENKVYSTCLPTLYRENNFNHLIENLKRAELEILLESHPIFKLLKDGIELRSGIVVKLYNPYGLAQHYSFNTTLLDLTSDIDVASFFATCQYNRETFSYTPYTKSKSCGVLYVYHMLKPFSILTNEGLSTIGLHIFARPGLQKGFFWASNPEFSKTGSPRDLNECGLITKIYFKHENSISERICADMEFGKKIFPEDELSIKCKDILNSNVFSEEAFERNLSDNPQDDREANRKKIEKEGYGVSSLKQPLKFSDEEKNHMLFKIHNGGWSKLCDSIVMPIDKDGSLMEVLRNVPNDDRYKKYFS
ncbi:hypothetical protein CMT47_19580 [Elizabethkingia anophelis]|nr:hypothetical protein [Elizabethkingia anophelis]MDV4088327.1 hypothetical protein [Elizabethkingia anophelis]